MITDLLHFFIKLARAAFLIFGIHFIVNYLGPFPLEDSLFYKIHLFHFIASLLMYPVVIVAFHNALDRAGFAYLASSVFKMLVSLVFLVPHVLPKKDFSQNFSLQFCVIFIAYLIFESSITIRKLNE